MEKKKEFPGFDHIIVDYLVPLMITVGVAIALFVKVAPIASPSPKSDTYTTFYSLSNGLENYYDFKTAWKPRLFSNSLAAFTAHVSDWLLAKTSVPVVKNSAELTVALWTAGWFILICFLLIWFLKRRSVFFILGTFAGISFGYLSRLHMAARVYPWDLPALFFFTGFVLLFTHKKYWWIFAFIPLSIGFKETTFILCAVFLFAELPWKQRLGMLVGSVALAMGVKIAIDLFIHAPLFFTMETKLNGDVANNFYLLENLQNLKDILPFFINAGTLTAFFILPNINKNILVLKLIAIPFILGNMVFGNIIEYRIWFEMIPFALYALDENIYHYSLKNEIAPV
jgi:hypothetical protein